jgi:hypothetical protein
MTRLIVSAALVGAAVVVRPCEPNIARCDPASPLYDRVLCYYSGGAADPACDPFGPAFDPNYCASQRGGDR